MLRVEVMAELWVVMLADQSAGCSVAELVAELGSMLVV